MDWIFRGRFTGNRKHDTFIDGDPEFENRSTNDAMRDSFDTPIFDPFENLEDTSHDLFQRMDDMLNRMFSASFALESEKFSEQAQKENPRAMMLKDPEYDNRSIFPNDLSVGTEQRSALIDSDIDDKIFNDKGLLNENPFEKTEPCFSYKKFSSIRTVRLPDGTLEEQRSVTDSHGNTTTTVRRSIGDQGYEITTHSDEKGLKEKVEKFMNLEENDFQNFEKKWQDIKSESNLVPLFESKFNASEPKIASPAGDPLYMSLFKKFFGF
ncbi:retrovirus-related Pol polyprotein from type-1 retrotransposable element R1 [Caerostris darwini]|uniref:Retrovirus-related Pol polyprotein from type-1 retrotransposable element R1 n=1 Tax=Caerostris darwini TaxID=1538125 RepID=A0AAV4SZP3_9ARAC|nr:retrovirus-related Pol polyprotein from type-1 retrotransposable element R1 [Caerostris darwini]